MTLDGSILPASVPTSLVQIPSACRRQSLEDKHMSQIPINPSQQVERIREILVGREIGRMDRRLTSLEATKAPQRVPDVTTRVADAQQVIIRETQELKQRIQQETLSRQQQIAQLAQKISRSSGSRGDSSQVERQVSERMEAIAAEMSSRVDARTREILHHLQSEILQWKHQMDRELQSIRDVKADRKEVTSRFARIAAAALEDDADLKPQEGFLL